MTELGYIILELGDTMKLYNIPEGVRSSIEVFFNCSRGTGRTTSMLKSLKIGDTVVFLTHEEARRVYNQCRSVGIQLLCLVAGVEEVDKIIRHSRHCDTLVLDHRWVEEYYKHAIEIATKDLEVLAEGRY